FLNSKIPSEEIEKERGVIIEEINMYNDNPMMYIDELWKTVLYGDQPAGWDVAGTKETVSTIKREQIVKYIDSQYTAANTIICVAGKIKEKEMIAKVKKYFNKVKTSKANGKLKVVENQLDPQLIVSYKDIGQTNLALGVRGYSIFHPQKQAADILGIILGGMMSSRMFIEVREKLGAAYYVRTHNQSDTDTGSLVTFAGVDNKKLHKVIETILREYKKMTTEKVSSRELKKAKDYLKGKMVLGLESSDAQASFYGSQELLKSKILTLEEIVKKIDKVTADDIMKVSKDIFKLEKLNLAMIGPFKDKQEFKKLLKF
ncbi:MAG: pitrilysin family protein, partial [Candidatus Pacebacteria bacterium]|nr:pitrilysin family protein [Candidatus Paceibacterota bacterium]